MSDPEPAGYEVTQDRDPWTKMPIWLPRMTNATAVAVYAELASYAWMRDGSRPAIKRVADSLNMAERTVRRAIQCLEEVGAVVVEHRYADDEKRVKLPSRYHLKFQAPSDTGVTPPVTGDRTPPVTSDRTLRSPVTYEVDRKEVDRREVEKEGTLDIPVRAPGYTAEFERWWAIYPKGKAKGEAAKAYQKALKLRTHSELLEAAQRYADDPNQPDNATYIPNAATWLNARSWDDDPLPPRPGANGRPTGTDRVRRIYEMGRQLAAEQQQREIQ